MKKKGCTVSVLIINIVIALLLSGCTPVKSGEAPSAEGEIPDMVLTSSRYVFGRENDNPVVFNAEKIVIYSDVNQRTELSGVLFSQSGADGDAELYGKCGGAVITEDNTVARLYGGVHLEKKTDYVIIDCDNLLYNDNDNTLSTDSEIDISYGGDTHIKAKGFSAGLSDNRYEFAQITEGVITLDD